MSAILTLFACCLGLASPQNPRVASLTGDVRRHESFRSEILGNTRTLTVYLPPQYASEPKRRFPVVYFHDGQNVFDGMTSFIPNSEWRADETAEALIRAGLIEPLILVGIDNAGAQRADEYLPTSRAMPNSGPTIGGKADLYGKMIRTEVMPFIEKTYRVSTGPGNTGLIGSSFGGIATLHLGLTHPRSFGKLGVVSPSLWWDEGLMLRTVKALPSRLPLKIWLDMGTAESGGHLATRELQRTLQSKGWRLGRDLAYYEEVGGRHNEDAWAKRLGLILLFLFPSKR